MVNTILPFYGSEVKELEFSLINVEQLQISEINQFNYNTELRISISSTKEEAMMQKHTRTFKRGYIFIH